MGSITITKRFEFDAAHRLLNHEGKCANLHGHRYVAELTVSGPALDHVGRVVDFGELKRTVGHWIDEHWDHGYVYQVGDPVGALAQEFGKTYPMLLPPTAENMVLDLAVIAAVLLGHTPLRVVQVRLYETPTCWADYRPE